MAKRPNILKLATKISLESMTYMGITYDDPEYKILEPIIDDDMCAIMMHLRLEANRTVEDVAKRARKSVEYTQEQLDKLCKTGAVRYRYVDGKRCYFYPIWVPGIMEGILANREQCDKYPVLGESFEAYTRRRPEMLAPMLDSGKTGMFFMRVMPVMSAIENNSRTASYDELKTLIDNATAISVGPCSCRRARRLMGEGCGHLEEDMCMYLNDNALCFSEQGYHRLVSKEEAYEILQRAEDNGLVHEINQTPGFEDATAICNCCGCSCFALRIEELFRTPRAIRSNYIARVDKEKCVACGQCVENCQTNALKLGQKHCATDPHISDTYDTDASVPFHRSSYNPEYRTNRSDVMPSGTAPCKAVCPLNIPVQGCLQLLSVGRYDDAAALIRQATPFPELCGSVCGRQCEKVCTRNQIDAAVAIADVCKTLIERERSAGKVILPPVKNPTGIPHTEKIAVIGAGPAGLSCAYFLRQQGYPVTVLEKDTVLGGAPATLIPSFRLDRKAYADEIDVLARMGVEFRTGVEVGKDTTLDALRAEGYKAFFLGIGAGKQRKDAPAGTVDARRYLHRKRQTVKGSVVVLGGGKEAIDCARAARKGGAASVTVVTGAIRADISEAKKEGVAFRAPYAVQEIRDGAVSIRSLHGDKTEELAADTVFAAEDYVPAADAFTAGSGVCLNADGFVGADAVTRQTGEADVFAGGAATGAHDVARAIAEGREAAISIHRFVHSNQSFVIGRDKRDYKPLARSSVGVAIDELEAAPRQTAENGLLSDAQLHCEAGRCLGCGTVVLNEDQCIGCGICTTKCKFDAIRLEKVNDTHGREYFRTLLTVAGNTPAAIGRLVRKTRGR